MTKIEMTAAILAAKKSKKTTWAAISKAARISEVYCTSACLGENALEVAEARKVASFLRLPSKVAEALAELACKGEAAPAESAHCDLISCNETIFDKSSALPVSGWIERVHTCFFWPVIWIAASSTRPSGM